MPDVVRYNKNQHCPFIVFQNMFDAPIVHRYATRREVKTPKHGRRDRCCNSVRRYITGRRKFGIAEALQFKPFSVNGHLNNFTVRFVNM